MNIPPKLQVQKYQTKAIDRVANNCRNQKGHLLLHSMGSGKTRTSLLIANFVARSVEEVKKIVIVTPPDIDASWKGEYKNLESSGIDLTGLERAPISYVTYSQLKDPATLAQLGSAAAETFLLFDEAHYLQLYLDLDVILSFGSPPVMGCTTCTIRYFLRKLLTVHVKKYLLITGTPVYKNTSGFVKLLNLLSGSIDLTSSKYVQESEKGFYQRFRLEYRLDRLYGYTANVADFLNGIQQYVVILSKALTTVAPTALSTSSTRISGEQSINVGLEFVPTSYLPVVVGAAAAAGMAITTAPVAVPFAVTLAGWTSTLLIVQALVNISLSLTNTFFKEAIDPVKLTTFLRPYIDVYEHKPEPDSDTQIPEVDVEYYYSDLNEFQIRQLLFFCKNPTLFLNEADFVFANESEGLFDDIITENTYDFTNEDFTNNMRVLGNIAPLWKNTRTLLNFRFPDEKRPEHPLDRFSFTAVKIAPNGDKLKAKPQTYRTAKFAHIHNILKQNERRDFQYLPIIYSNFDVNGFRHISAFLTMLNHRHIALSPSLSKDERTYLIGLAQSSKADLVKEFGQDNIPDCILLHPEYIEGLDFVFNPYMIVMEMPEGYGKQKQLYARILRTVNIETYRQKDGSQVKFSNGAERKPFVRKRIYQLMSGAIPLTVDPLLQKIIPDSVGNDIMYFNKVDFQAIFAIFTTQQNELLLDEVFGEEPPPSTFWQNVPLPSSQTFGIRRNITLMTDYIINAKAHESARDYFANFKYALDTLSFDDTVRIKNTRQGIFFNSVKKALEEANGSGVITCCCGINDPVLPPDYAIPKIKVGGKRFQKATKRRSDGRKRNSKCRKGK